MTNPRTPTQLDSRRIFQFYAASAAIAGVAIMAMKHGSVLAIFGAALIASACMALGIASSADGEVRRVAGGWFAIGHVVVIAAMLGAQPDLPHAMLGVNLMVGVAFLFYFVWLGSDNTQRRTQPLVSLFGKPGDDDDRLRTRYEESIRVAGGQEIRHRLARDLHDSVKQQLFVVQTAAATAQVRFDSDPAGAREAIDDVRAAARDALAEMQAMLDQLNSAPLENNGLVASLQKQCEALKLRTGVEMHLEIGELPPSNTVEPGAPEALFRTAQEALSNIARHARAKNVWVTLDALAGQLSLRIRDDGAGFDTNRQSSGMGIANMKGRALEFGGTFEVTSVPGEGTAIAIAVPYLDIVPEHHGRKAAAWAAVVVASATLIYWKRELMGGWIIALICLEFTRQFVAWRRTRRTVQ